MEELRIKNWERFSAIRPKFSEINPEEYSEYNTIQKLNKKYIKGSIGCKLSHLEIIKTAKKRNYKNILILEDDIELNSNFSFVKLAYKELQSNLRWDILYLGLNKEKIKEINDLMFPHKVEKGLCTHAYIVNYLSYTKIINILENSKKQIDLTYQDNFNKNIKCYLIKPKIFKQNKSYSDINRNFL